MLELVKEQAPSHKDAFYVVDLSEVAAKHQQWVQELPRVRPYYAVKCNDDPHIVATLARLGAGFDCASKGEMSMALKLGVSPSDIIFAHPAKQPSHISYAKAKGVTRMTFDNEDELRKIGTNYPGAEAVLRILTDDSASVCRLGLKFGAPLDIVPRLLDVAKECGVNVIGISYHVGSGNGDATAFGGAVREAKRAFDIAKTKGFNFKLLDIGGGYPGSEIGAEGGNDKLPAPEGANHLDAYAKHPSFQVMASHIRSALDECFPEGCGVELMSEPGRYFVKSSHALAVSVVGKRQTIDEATGGPRYNYYVNDGLYGSFNCILYDHVQCAPSLLLSNRDNLATATSLMSHGQNEDAIATVDTLTSTITIADKNLGMSHAADLAAATVASKARELLLAASVDEEEQTQLRTMSMGGGGSSTSSFNASTGTTSAAATTAAIINGAKMMMASSSSSSTSRPYGYASLPAITSTTGLPSTLPTTGSQTFPTTLWGPTCDSMDKIHDAISMPELHAGDWLVFENMGAYTIAGSCRFNGFPLASKVYMHLDGSIEVQKEELVDGEEEVLAAAASKPMA